MSACMGNRRRRRHGTISSARILAVVMVLLLITGCSGDTPTTSGTTRPPAITQPGQDGHTFTAADLAAFDGKDGRPRPICALWGLLIGTALARRRFRLSWRCTHRLNYLIFVAVLIQGLVIRYDLRNEIVLKAWFALYAAIALAGYVFLTLRAPGRAKLSPR